MSRNKGCFWPKINDQFMQMWVCSFCDIHLSRFFCLCTKHSTTLKMKNCARKNVGSNGLHGMWYLWLCGFPKLHVFSDFKATVRKRIYLASIGKWKVKFEKKIIEPKFPKYPREISKFEYLLKIWWCWNFLYKMLKYAAK